MSRNINVLFAFVLCTSLALASCREKRVEFKIEFNMAECFVDGETSIDVLQTGGVCESTLKEYAGDESLMACVAIETEQNRKVCSGVFEAGATEVALNGCTSNGGKLEELSTNGDQLTMKFFLMDVGVGECPTNLTTGKNCDAVAGCLLALRPVSGRTEFEDENISFRYGDDFGEMPCQPECGTRSELCLAPGATVASCLNHEPAEGEGEGEGEGPEEVCTFPAMRPCSCDDLRHGTQLCLRDGNDWAVCDCGSPLQGEGEGSPPDEGEGEGPVPGEGEGTPPGEGEGVPPVEGEGEGEVVEGEGEIPTGEGEGTPAGEGEGAVGEGEGEGPADEGEGEEGEGEGPPPDPCENVVCNEPPLDHCDLDGDVVDYAPGGACAEGDCDYDFNVIPCDFGCAEAECLPDPCGDNVVESCNGLDDDCDGEIDEVLGLGLECVVGQGSCERVGLMICNPPEGNVVCSTQAGHPQAELCNSLDDDCDGVTDEEPADVGEVCSVGIGMCRRVGNTECQDGLEECGVPAGEQGIEVCNSLDDDCDDEVDENPTDVGEACSAGIGQCRRQGVTECRDGREECGAQRGDPVAESCNSLDDDCDGETDEGFAQPCHDCRVGADEVCNGFNDDCDGEVDEDAVDVGEACAIGVGECRREGVTVCQDGREECDAQAGDPVIEFCNDRDDDCDGETDEDFVPPQGWSCIPPTGPDGFLMGSPPDEVGRGDDEVQHRVVITRPFIIQQTEVTQEEWRTLMGNNPSAFAGCDTCPVDQAHWYDALAYANTLSRAEGLEECYALGDASWPRGLDCEGYRLPTEAEWEYAARAGSEEARYAEPLADIGWYGENSGARTNPVGQKLPNAWGLYDTLGNNWEYVWDRYGDYSVDPAEDPIGPAQGATSVLRGGAWNHVADDCRAASRSATNPGSRGGNIGFRLVRTIN